MRRPSIAPWLCALALTIVTGTSWAQDAQATPSTRIPPVDILISFPNQETGDSLSNLLLQRSGWTSGAYIAFFSPRLVSTLKFNCINASVRATAAAPIEAAKLQAYAPVASAPPRYVAVVIPKEIKYLKSRGFISGGTPIGGAGSMTIRITLKELSSDTIVGEGDGAIGFFKAEGGADELAHAITDLLVSKQLLAIKNGFHTPDGQNPKSSAFDWDRDNGRPMAEPRNPPSNFLTRRDSIVPSECPSGSMRQEAAIGDMPSPASAPGTTPVR